MASPDLLDPVLGDLAARIRAALVAAGLPEIDPALERPKQADHGDWATTAPLRLAKPAQRPPREIAQALVDNLDLPDVIESVDIAGPGFVNFRFAHRYHEELIRRVLDEGEAFGRRTRDGADVESVNVEFVSANPTGPLHVGAGRWAATGDAIAALLEADGHRVVREYYVNDAGEQIRRFGESVVLVARGQELTDEHYRGATIADIADQLRAEHGDDLFTQPPAEAVDLGGGGVGHQGGSLVEDDASSAAADPRVDPRIGSVVGVLGVEAMRQRIEDVLHTMGVDFDTWFSERTLHERGAIRATVEQLTADGRTYEADGAVFLRTEEHGDDKDRVLVRSDGRPTYFAADCAYMRDKWTRRPMSAPRRRAAVLPPRRRPPRLRGAPAGGRRLPRHPDGPDRDPHRAARQPPPRGEPVRMSKRAGETVDLDEVVDEVGVDVTRYHFLRQGSTPRSTSTWRSSRSSRWRTRSTTSSTPTPGSTR
jgi:arginyl-tRNA synthetase